MSPSSSRPRLPHPEFPLRPHRNGKWFKSVWDRRTKKSRQYYFGSWTSDPAGERALHDPVQGWFARREAIFAGIDHLRAVTVAGDVTLGELMRRFLQFKRDQVTAGELSAVTLGDYLVEVGAFVAMMKPGTPPSALRPEHFAAYRQHLIGDRKLGRHAMRRVRAYVNCFLGYGAKNGYFTMPPTGAEWVAPATDPDAMRQARARSGARDFSDRIVTGAEVDRLLERASPTFRAMILLALNAGLGPADIGRLRWNSIDLQARMLKFPRWKTGTPRACFLWKKTCRALRRVARLKRNRELFAREGTQALVFLTRRGQPYYRESNVVRVVTVEGAAERKLAGVRVHKAIQNTFGRMVRELKLEGVTFYRLRHTARTLAGRSRDQAAIDLLMGHRGNGSGYVYDHAEISRSRLRRVARTVFRGLWPKRGG